MTASPGLGSLEARRGVARRGTASLGGVISGDEEGACLGKDGALLFMLFIFILENGTLLQGPRAPREAGLEGV